MTESDHSSFFPHRCLKKGSLLYGLDGLPLVSSIVPPRPLPVAPLPVIESLDPCARAYSRGYGLARDEYVLVAKLCRGRAARSSCYASAPQFAKRREKFALPSQRRVQQPSTDLATRRSRETKRHSIAFRLRNRAKLGLLVPIRNQDGQAGENHCGWQVDDVVAMNDQADNSAEEPADVMAIINQADESNERMDDEFSGGDSSSSSTSESELGSINEDDGLFMNPSTEQMAEHFERNDQWIAQLYDRRSLEHALEVLLQRNRFCRMSLQIRLDEWHHLRRPTPVEEQEAKQNIWQVKIDMAAAKDAAEKVRRLLDADSDEDSDAGA